VGNTAKENTPKTIGALKSNKLNSPTSISREFSLKTPLIPIGTVNIGYINS